MDPGHKNPHWNIIIIISENDFPVFNDFYRISEFHAVNFSIQHKETVLCDVWSCLPQAKWIYGYNTWKHEWSTTYQPILPDHALNK